MPGVTATHLDAPPAAGRPARKARLDAVDLLQFSSTGTLPRTSRRTTPAEEPDPPLKGMGRGLAWREP